MENNFLFIFVFLGGGVGASVRFLLSHFLNKRVFPYGTLLANFLACTLLIICLENFNESDAFFNTFFIFGISSSLSTFSSFIFDIYKMFTYGFTKENIIYILSSICFVFLFFFS